VFQLTWKCPSARLLHRRNPLHLATTTPPHQAASTCSTSDNWTHSWGIQTPGPCALAGLRERCHGPSGWRHCLRHGAFRDPTSTMLPHISVTCQCNLLLYLLVVGGSAYW
jgi:hypothetical protein